MIYRSFIRPSGTEDVVRLYVEAENQDDLKELNLQLTELVKNNKDIN
jgi:phosphomannomutase